MSNTHYRRATANDVPFLCRAIVGSGERNMHYLLSRVDSSALSRWVTARDGLFSYRYFWVIEHQGKIAACASVLPTHRALKALLYFWWQARPYTYTGLTVIKRLNQLSSPMCAPPHAAMISSVFVEENARNKGLGYRLMSAITQQYKDTLALQVACDNKPAIRLYEKLQFKAVGVSSTSSVVAPHPLMVLRADTPS